MDWADTPEQAAFRAEVRRFIEERFPEDYRRDATIEQSLEPEDVFGYHWAADRLSDDPQRRAAVQKWTARLAERGWVAPHWPKEYGGDGLDATAHYIFSEEMARAGVPTAGGIGVSLVGPTLIAHGSEEQRRDHLSKILRGDVAWAQGFSEPAAGSDLAALTTRAARDGNEYVVNGQKIWTSAAQYAQWLCILVRTDPDAPRHRGLSFLLVHVDTPGLSVRPIEDMGGAVPFNEIFLEDVRLPVRQIVGEENRGWYVAMAMLDFERSGIGGVVSQRLAVDELVRGECRRRRAGCGRLDGGALRGRLADHRIETEVAYQFALRTVSMQTAGEMPSHEASINQLFRSEMEQRIARTAVSAAGLHGQLRAGDHPACDETAADAYLRAVPSTLLSGTSEIQRTVIATRGLRLPRG